MTGRGAAVQGGLAAIGLAAAYATWQRPPASTAGEVLVLDVTRNDLGKVRYQDGDKWMELDRRKEAGEPAVWLRTSARKEPAAPEREVRGNDSAGKFLDRFAPLRAVRSLGALSPGKLKELGLEGSTRRLEVSARGDRHPFLAGAPAPGGETYLRDERDGQVYLMPRAFGSDLDASGGRFIDRALHAFKLADARTVTVSAGGKRRDLALRNAESPAPKLAPAAAPDKPDDLASNWHEKVWRLWPMEVLGRGEKPSAGEPAPDVRVEYHAPSGSLGWIEIGKLAAPPPPLSEAKPSQPPPAAEAYYARTERTAGWVKLGGALGDLLDEASKIAAAR